MDMKKYYDYGADVGTFTTNVTANESKFSLTMLIKEMTRLQNEYGLKPKRVTFDSKLAPETR